MAFPDAEKSIVTKEKLCDYLLKSSASGWWNEGRLVCFCRLYLSKLGRTSR